MSEREYEMTQEQVDAIKEASKPVPVMFLSGGQLMGGTPQENANRAWQKLGTEMGFKFLTVRRSPKGERFFFAEPTDA